MSRKTEKVVLSGILTQFYFCEFRGEEFFNSHRPLRSKPPCTGSKSVTAISRQLAGHSIFKGVAASRWDWFSVLAIEVFQTRHVADGGHSFASSNFASA